jgi:type IV fimbrial biogenesis protein FimT
MGNSGKHPHGSTDRGFTALEILLVISILAVVLVMGIPSFRDFGLRQRMSAAVDKLQGHLALARHEAINRNTQVVACPGNRTTGCANSTDWSNGWIVFSDFNGDRRYQAGEILHRVETGQELLVIHSSAGRTNLRFYPNGSAPGSNGSITFCDLRGPDHARKLVISNIGRIRRDDAPELDPSHCPPVER